jgi:hypothetical protein
VSQHQGSSSSPNLSSANRSNGLTNNNPMTRYKEPRLCHRGASILRYSPIFGCHHHAAATSFTRHLPSTRIFPSSSRAQLHLSEKLTSQIPRKEVRTDALASSLPRPTTKERLPVASSILILDNTHSCRTPSNNNTPLSPSLVRKQTFYEQHSPIKQRRRCLNKLTHQTHQSKNTS